MGWSEFGLVIIEGSLPDGQGEKLAQEVRQSNPETLIIAIDDDTVGRANFRKLGCQFVCEPDKVTRLLKRVVAALEH